MSYELDDDASQIRRLKDQMVDLQALVLASQFSVQQENQESGQSIFPGANPSARGGGSGGGGSTVIDPLILNSVDHGTIGLVSENIDLSENGGNTHFMTLSGDVTFGFTAPPVSGKMERFILHIKMDATGGHVVTWPAAFLSPPTIDTTPNAVNKVEIYTFDGGMTYHALTVTSGGGGASNLWSNIVIDIPSKDMMASNLEKLGDITFSEIGQSILTDPIGLFYTVPVGQEHIFSLAGIPKLTVGNDSILAGTILNMADNKINQAQHITFSGNETLNLVTEAGVGFDNISNFQIYNVPLTNQSHVFAAAGELLGSISRIGASSGQLTIDNVVAGDLLQTNGQLFLSTVATPAPLFDGAIWRDVSGIFKARQNGITENLISADASLWSTFPATTDVDLTTNAVTILGGGAGEGMTNTGHIDFVDNLATPVAPLSIYSDGIDLFANTGGGVVNLSDIGDNEFFGPWTANHDAGTKSLVNLGLAQYVDTGSVPRGTVSGDSGASAIRLATASGGKFIISDVITDIAEFTDAVGLKMLGTHGINLNKNIINTIGETQYDRTVGFSPTVANTIGFDNVTNFLKYNVGLTTDTHAWYAAGELLANISRVAANSGQLSIDNVVSNLLQADEQLFLSSTTTPSPLFNGAIWRDSADGLFKARQNGITENLIGGGSPGVTDKISEGDSSIEIIDTLGPGGSAQFVIDGVTQGNITNALGWVFDTNATFGGPVTTISSADINLGDNTTDRVTFAGSINSDVIPIDTSRDLGSPVFPWSKLWSKDGDYTGVVNIAGALDVHAGIDANLSTISNLADPTLAHHAATKSYVDAQVGGGSSPPFDDNQAIIQDEIDNTKTLSFNLSLNSTGDANLISSATTASRIWSFPNKSGTVALLDDIGATGEPILFTITTVTPQTPPTKTNIDASLTNVFEIALDRDIDLDIINPSASKFEMIHIVITQDATGSRAITWPGSVNGTPSINTTALSETTVSLFNMADGSWRFVTTQGGVIASTGATTIDELTDTNISLPISDNSFLVYNVISSKWENASGNGILGIDQLSDVTIATPLDDQVLTYETSSGLWKNKTFAGGGGAHDLDSHTDVTLVAPSSGNYIRFGGVVWSNSDVLWADLSMTGSSINDIENVSLNTVLDNQFLQFNSASGKWENVTVTPGAGLQNIVEDLSPELGGNLDALGKTMDNVSSITSNATNPATSGAIRLGNNESILWRDNGNTSNIGFQLNTSDRIVTSGPLIAVNSSTPLGVSSARWGTAWVSAIDNIGTLQVGGIATFDDDVHLGSSSVDRVSISAQVDTDIDFVLGSTVDFNANKNSSTSGIANPLPANPETYVEIKVNGTKLYVPAYKA